MVSSDSDDTQKVIASPNRRRVSLSRGIALLCCFVVAFEPQAARSGSKTDRWVARNYDVFFQWSDHLRSLRIVNEKTGKPETDPDLQYVALRESESIVRQLKYRTGLKTAEGQFRLGLQGESEPYLMSWSGADIPALDQLMHAAATWDLETVQELISGGMTVDARALDSGNTPLILAASNPTELFLRAPKQFRRAPNEETFGYLLTAGANPNAKGYQGATALMRSNDTRVVETLILRGADVNAKDDDGWTALNYAVENGDSKKLQILLSAHAEVNSIDKKGWTPLMYSVSEGDLPTTRLLLASGADTRLKDNKGKTALTIARSKQKLTVADKEIIRLLSANSPDARRR